MNVQDWREIHRLHTSGMPIKAIARHLGMSRNTVRKALEADSPPTPRQRRGSAIDPFEPRIRALLAECPTMTATEIASRIGWNRSMTVLRDRVRALRAGAEEAASPRGPTVSPSTRVALPAELTEFVGRREQLSTIRQLLASTRLATLTGPGGVGKTRLAIQAAREVRRAFADGVQWIELGALRDPQLLAQTVVDGLGIADRNSARDPTALLTEFLENKQLLLILDNCEHLLGAGAELVSTLLHGAPGLRIIATSREALSIPGEHVLHVPPLPVPDQDSAHVSLSETDDTAVALFVARARDVLSDFSLTDDNVAAVHRICTQLDGLPLAIELACTRLRALSVHELADRLDHRLQLLTSKNRAVPKRHRSLQATMDWSFELCDSVERKLWTRVSVFAGSFDLKAAEQVCQYDALSAEDILDGIDGLVSKSLLLRVEHCGHVRFRMLETLREYGQSLLDKDAAHTLRRRHHAYYSQMIRQATEQWFSARQHQWCTWLRLEHANLRTAFETALDMGHNDSGEPALYLVGAPWFLWAASLSFTEHRYWLQRALDRDHEPTAYRARALATLGLVATLQGDRDSARLALAEGTKTAELVDDAYAVAYNRHILGLVAFFNGEFEASERIMLDALAVYKDTDTPADLVGALLVHLGLLYIFAGDTKRALKHFEQLRPPCEEHGERWLLSYALLGLGLTSLMCQDYEQAARYATESLRLKQPFDDTIGFALIIELLAWIHAGQEKFERAAVLFGAAETLWGSVGMQLYGSPHWLAQRTRFQRSARDGLGEALYRSAFQRGQDMSRDQAIRLALNEPHDSTTQQRHQPVLSRRESEVASLVAEGLSNREIAQKLVISHRTVEGHVERILKKLGLARREQVASWMAQQHAAAGHR